VEDLKATTTLLKILTHRKEKLAHIWAPSTARPPVLPWIVAAFYSCRLEERRRVPKIQKLPKTSTRPSNRRPTLFHLLATTAGQEDKSSARAT
jgi:hypothetical protein